MIDSLFKVMYFDLEYNTWRTDTFTKYRDVADSEFFKAQMHYPGDVKLSRFMWTPDSEREMEVIKYVKRKK